MKYIICFFIFSLSIQAKQIVMLTDLSSLKWKHRIIVVNTVNHKKGMVEIFQQNKAELNERDIVWFVIQGDTISTNFNGHIADDFVSNMTQQYQIDQDKVILLGKDGTIKSSRENLDLASILSDIDAMPMRQIEMQSQ